MGQKIHPGGLRVGVIHDWKSNWYTGKKEFADYILEDVRIREHINGKLVDELLFGKLEHGGSVQVDVKDDQLTFAFAPAEGGAAPDDDKQYN